MILNNAPQNEAILSNVGQVGEFRIRNSAKAFSILSSGLYANKIRAIIRELSCNAIDSHTAAGKLQTPFDIHLPNTLEPWFSIRDYGTGLTHDQVTNLYTTYFESTKTDSNAFIGALGLGSKSPFSYTDNFTVTAVKDGIRGIYTAFINEVGVPSIALMTQGKTTEPNGVEVKFSVNSQSDYQKFITEAKQVYKYFKLRPIVSGCDRFEFEDVKYNTKNLSPGIHRVEHNTNYSKQSVAIMGNIEYPIQVPESEAKALGDLGLMLNCGLVIEFGIGQLDFQASREGLSYVGITLQSIKSKLTLLRDDLLIKITTEANKLDNLWNRAIYLAEKIGDNLYKASVKEYLTKTNFGLVKDDRYASLKFWNFSEKLLADTYNIKIRQGSRMRGEYKCSTVKPSQDYHNPGSNGDYYRIGIDQNSYFVITDTRRGAFERAKLHWRKKAMQAYQETFFVLEPVDKTKPMKTTEFFGSIYNPPSNQILLASSLDQKPKVEREKRTSILVIEERRRRGARYSTWVWSNDGDLSDYDDTKTYYYVPLVQFQPETKSTEKDMKEVYQKLIHANIFNGKLYGVNKKDIAAVKAKKNWVHIDELVVKSLSAQNSTSAKSLAKSSIDFEQHFNDNVIALVNSNSPLAKLYAEFKGVKAYNDNYNIKPLMMWYGVSDGKAELEQEQKAWVEKIREVSNRYTLLKHLGYRLEAKQVAEYINMVDQVKGI